MPDDRKRETVTLDQALQVALGAMSWWRSDGDPNEDVGDLEGAAAVLSQHRKDFGPEAMAFFEAALAECERCNVQSRCDPEIVAYRAYIQAQAAAAEEEK